MVQTKLRLDGYQPLLHHRKQLAYEEQSTARQDVHMEWTAPKSLAEQHTGLQYKQYMYRFRWICLPPGLSVVNVDISSNHRSASSRTAFSLSPIRTKEHERKTYPKQNVQRSFHKCDSAMRGTTSVDHFKCLIQNVNIRWKKKNLKILHCIHIVQESNSLRETSRMCNFN